MRTKNYLKWYEIYVKLDNKIELRKTTIRSLVAVNS